MLTGDKIETATVIAISTKLVSRNQYIHQVSQRASNSLLFSWRHVLICLGSQ
jgi:phospholipid-translocating ATPase